MAMNDVSLRCITSKSFHACDTVVVFVLAVDSCVPGDVVTISGVVKVMGADEGTTTVTVTTFNTVRHF